MKANSLSKASGFTLIEILVVVALIAILAAIAMPAYNNYINRGKIKTAQADLVALSLNLENVYQRKLAYPTAVYANTGDVTGAYTGWSPASDKDDFEYSTSLASGDTGYKVIATGKAGGVKDCVIALNHKGERTLTSCPYGNGEWL